MMEISIFEYVFFTIVLLCAFGFVLSWIILSLTLDRRLLREFKRRNDIAPQESWFLRNANNVFCVVFPSRSSTDPIMNAHYRGFPFRDFAKPAEIILCFLFAGSMLVLVTLAFAGLILDFFGFIQLERP